MNNSGQESKAQLEERLQKLALEAQQNQPGSAKRRLALTRLSQELMQPGCIAHPATSFPREISQEIYQEARQNLLLHVCQKIDQYNPEKASVLTWVNFLMKKRFFPEATPDVIGSIKDIKVISELQKLIHEYEEPLSEKLRNYVEQYPDHLLQVSMKSRSHITFQFLLIHRLNGKKWRELAENYEVPLTALNDFYNRKLNELKPAIKSYLNN